MSNILWTLFGKLRQLSCGKAFTIMSWVDTCVSHVDSCITSSNIHQCPLNQIRCVYLLVYKQIDNLFSARFPLPQICTYLQELLEDNCHFSLSLSLSLSTFNATSLQFVPIRSTLPLSLSYSSFCDSLRKMRQKVVPLSYRERYHYRFNALRLLDLCFR